MENETLQLPPLRVGITHGDVNGIGYEVMIKTLGDSRILELFTPIIYGSSKVASYHRKALDISDIHFNIIRSADQAVAGKVNLINITSDEIKIDLGQITDIAGEMAFQALEAATEDLQKGKLDALVTAPINKQNIQRKQFNFPGHTEYLTKKFEAHESLMLMVSHTLRIGVLTGHVALRDVPGSIHKDAIIQKIRVFSDSLERDFGIRKPRIALLGLNPHASDQGVIGKEEQEVIIPALQEAFEEGILAFGPYPADGFFGSSNFQKFDGILAMYHDQGLIPFKTLSFGSGVNFTAGLPFVRTSPAHGTAFDIAGKNQASPNSFREAVYLAIDIARNRKIYDEVSANPLKFSVLEDDSDTDKNILKNLPDDSNSNDL